MRFALYSDDSYTPGGWKASGSWRPCWSCGALQLLDQTNEFMDVIQRKSLCDSLSEGKPVYSQWVFQADPCHFLMFRTDNVGFSYLIISFFWGTQTINYFLTLLPPPNIWVVLLDFASEVTEWRQGMNDFKQLGCRWYMFMVFENIFSFKKIWSFANKMDGQIDFFSVNQTVDERTPLKWWFLSYSYSTKFRWKRSHGHMSSFAFAASGG